MTKRPVVLPTNDRRCTCLFVASRHSAMNASIGSAAGVLGNATAYSRTGEDACGAINLRRVLTCRLPS